MISVFLFFLGLSSGSFLNVLIDRLPKGQSIMGRSRCDYCNTQLQAQDLIPIVSFALLSGRSRCCGKKISWQYPLVELLTGVIFLGIWMTGLANGPSIWAKLALTGILCSLLVIFFADLKYQIIPDEMQISLLGFALMFKLVQGGTGWFLVPSSIASAVIGAPILFLYLFTKGKGMGFGDVKLAFILGFLLGVKGGIAALYIAFLTGALVGGALIVLKRKGFKSKIAFGPFLVIGILAVLLFQRELNIFLQQFYGF